MEEKVNTPPQTEYTYKLIELLDYELDMELEKDESKMNTIKIQKLIDVIEEIEGNRPIPKELDKDAFAKHFNSSVGIEVIEEDWVLRSEVGLKVEELQALELEPQKVRRKAQKKAKKKFKQTIFSYFKTNVYKIAVVILSTLLGLSALGVFDSTSMADENGFFHWFGQKFNMINYELKGSSNDLEININQDAGVSLSNEGIEDRQMSSIAEVESVYNIDLLDFTYLPEGMELDYVEVKRAESGELSVSQVFVENRKNIIYRCQYGQSNGIVQFNVQKDAVLDDPINIGRFKISIYKEDEVQYAFFEDNKNVYTICGLVSREELLKIVEKME